MELAGDDALQDSAAQINLSKALEDLLSMAKRQPAILTVPHNVSASLSIISGFLNGLQQAKVSEKSIEPTDNAEGSGPALENEQAAAEIAHHEYPSTPLPPQLDLLNRVEAGTNIYLNRKTTLDKVYVYRNPGHTVNYPQTSATASVGHLFAMGPTDWGDIIKNIAYSWGSPHGGPTKLENGVPLLLDKDGNQVPCTVSHSTCQGMKRCPRVDISMFLEPHVAVTSSDLACQISKLHRPTDKSAEQKLFQKTLEYFVALKKYGCQAPPYETTLYSDSEYARRVSYEAHRNIERRGHDPKPTCDGRILYEYTESGKPYIRCEHYNARVNKDHLIDFGPSSGLYDSEYLEALFLDQAEVIEMYERGALEILQIGPYMDCLTVRNKNTVKSTCTSVHRNSRGELVNLMLEDMPCKSTFRLFQPQQEYREQCPFALLVCTNAHHHPIPIPSKTPPAIRSEVLNLIRSLYEDVPDLTPRRLLRHTSIKSMLRDRFPGIQEPMMLDIHPSLANRDHLRGYISIIQKELFPEGTGWKGVLHLMEQQRTKSPNNPYIRLCEEISVAQQVLDVEDLADDPDAQAHPLKIVICMTKSNSARLLNAKYVQCDIGFKRVHGFKEFELGGLDDVTGTAITYCRIFLTRQTAFAHRTIFRKIDEIVYSDTGKYLRWRHIHSDDPDTINHLAVDQHGGQAKGFGQYLMDVAKQLPNRPDLHVPQKMLHDLTLYDHLHRVLRLCANHYLRNIQKCAVPEPVRQKMRSLMCVRHPHWDQTITEISLEGGKPAQDWLRDKERSGFAFQAICWEKSFIPEVIWKVGDNTSNIIESLHQDVNYEGTGCTLLGGILKAQHFDFLKERTLENYSQTGVRSSYKSGTMSEKVARSLKRKANVTHHVLEREDNNILQQNKRVREAYDALQRTVALNTPSGSTRINATQEKFEKAVAGSRANIGKGSGKVGVLLPREEWDE